MHEPDTENSSPSNLPPWLQPIARLWLALGHRLGVINTFIILALVYYLVVTPLALLFRLTGRDALGLKWRKQDASHWIDAPRRWPPDSFRNQF